MVTSSISAAVIQCEYEKRPTGFLKSMIKDFAFGKYLVKEFIPQPESWGQGKKKIISNSKVI